MQTETYYERAKRLESESMQKTTEELGKLTVNFYNDPEYISKRAFNMGLRIAVEEVAGWEQLNILAYETCKPNFSDLKEATREHENQMRQLAVIKSKLEKKLL